MEIGQFNNLQIVRFTQNGIYLSESDNASEQVLLPKRYVTDEMKVGDQLNVFVYTDSEDRKVATTETPKLTVGKIASLKVVDVTRFGAFMDWGLSKDLFIPFSNQSSRMFKGEFYPVTAYCDEVTGRVVGSTKVSHLISNNEITVKTGEEVEILVARRLERGFRVIVNSRHWGMIYDNQIYSPVKIGDVYKAWVSRITDDKRIDLALQQPGFTGILVAVDSLKQALEESNGCLEVGDKSSPEEIQIHTGLSKKTFKRALGVLLREGKIEISNFTTKLK